MMALKLSKLYILNLNPVVDTYTKNNTEVTILKHHQMIVICFA